MFYTLMKFFLKCLKHIKDEWMKFMNDDIIT